MEPNPHTPNLIWYHRHCETVLRLEISQTSTDAGRPNHLQLNRSRTQSIRTNHFENAKVLFNCQKCHRIECIVHSLIMNWPPIMIIYFISHLHRQAPFTRQLSRNIGISCIGSSAVARLFVFKKKCFVDLLF